jgi:hypothetical protein
MLLNSSTHFTCGRAYHLLNKDTPASTGSGEEFYLGVCKTVAERKMVSICANLMGPQSAKTPGRLLQGYLICRIKQIAIRNVSGVHPISSSAE